MRLFFITIVGLMLSFAYCKQSKAGGSFTNKSRLGDVMMVMSPAYAFGMTFMAEDYEGMVELGGSVLAAQLTSETIKLMEIERRPNGKDWKSLPSGHAAGAFSGAMFVHKRYGWKPALVPYAMSLVAGWSRVAARHHYWHDVAAGAAVSALFTWILVDKYMPNGVTVSADTSSVQVGFSAKF